MGKGLKNNYSHELQQMLRLDRFNSIDESTNTKIHVSIYFLKRLYFSTVLRHFVVFISKI